jgi:hypothetical protein
MNRKTRALRNLGGAVAAGLTNPTGSGAEVMRTNVVLIERVILAVLRSEVDRLSQDRSECDRFFAHFYDPIVGEAERAEFVTNFMRAPPNVVLGYPRTSASFPCLSIVLASEEEVQNAVGDFISQTGRDSTDRLPVEFVGAHFSQSHMIYVYAEHPDVAIYLYQFAKLCLFGAKSTFLEAGCTEVTFAGGELAPDEGYMPENMFVRYLQVRAVTQVTVPRLLLVDPRRLRLGGVFIDDVVVDGVRGGVHPYAATTEDSDGEG